MSLNVDYDRDNIFAKIIRGELPCVKVYEDDDVLSFMDIFPQTRGHCLVIPKGVEATNFFDIAPDALQTTIARVQHVAKAALAGLKPDGVRIAQLNGSEAGQTVFHIHFHIIPMYEGVPMGRHGAGGQADPAELEALAADIRAHL